MTFRTVFAKTRAEHPGTDKGDRATGHVHHRGSGEVDVTVAQAPVVAHGREPAAAPDPVAKDGIEESAHAETVDDKGKKFPALRACTGRNDGRRVHEHHLEEKEGKDTRVKGAPPEEVT